MLPDGAAWNRAAAYLSGSPQLVWYMTFPQASFGGPAKAPSDTADPSYGPRHLGAILAQETCRTSGEAFCLSPWTMSSDDLHGQRGGSEWLKHLLVVCQVLEVPQLIQSS